jgi:hypothetical protein
VLHRLMLHLPDEAPYLLQGRVRVVKYAHTSCTYLITLSIWTNGRNTTVSGVRWATQWRTIR